MLAFFTPPVAPITFAVFRSGFTNLVPLLRLAIHRSSLDLLPRRRNGRRPGYFLHFRPSPLDNVILRKLHRPGRSTFARSKSANIHQPGGVFVLTAGRLKMTRLSRGKAIKGFNCPAGHRCTPVSRGFDRFRQSLPATVAGPPLKYATIETTFCKFALRIRDSPFTNAGGTRRSAVERGGTRWDSRFDASSNYFPGPVSIARHSICTGALLTKLYLAIAGREHSTLSRPFPFH